VDLYDLVRCLDDGSAQQADLKKRMRRVAKKDKVIDVPLNKHELEKVIVFLSSNLGWLHVILYKDNCHDSLQLESQQQFVHRGFPTIHNPVAQNLEIEIRITKYILECLED